MLTWIWWCPSSAQERPSSAALVWLFPLFPYLPAISNCFHSSMNVVDLRLLVEEGSAKPEEHRLQEADRLWPLGSSMAVRLLDGHLTSHVFSWIKVVKTFLWWYSKWGTAGLCIPGWFIGQADVGLSENIKNNLQIAKLLLEKESQDLIVLILVQYIQM